MFSIRTKIGAPNQKCFIFLYETGCGTAVSNLLPSPPEVISDTKERKLLPFQPMGALGLHCMGTEDPDVRVAPTPPHGDTNSTPNYLLANKL